MRLSLWNDILELKGETCETFLSSGIIKIFNRSSKHWGVLPLYIIICLEIHTRAVYHCVSKVSIRNKTDFEYLQCSTNVTINLYDI